MIVEEGNSASIITPEEVLQNVPGDDSSENEPAVLYLSQNLGAKWTPFANGIPKDATISGIKQFSNKVYIATDYHGIFVALDGKNNWVPIGGEELINLDINCVEVEDDTLIVGTLRQGVLTSTDGGVQWKRAKGIGQSNPIRAFIKLADRIYAGTDFGIFESYDWGATWSHTYGQLQILGFTSLNGKLYAASQHGALMFSNDSKTWLPIYEGDALHDIGNDGTYIFAMTIGKQLLKTQNDGITWENAQSGIPHPLNYYTNELKNIGNNIYSAQWIGIYQSSNNGSNWWKLEGLPDSTAFSTLEITDWGIMAGISIR